MNRYTAEELQGHRDDFRRCEFERLFEALDTYIIAVVTNHKSDDCADSVRLTELRKDLIEKLMNKEFDV